MAVDKIQTNAKIETGTLVNENYGTMTYAYNPAIKMCIVSWNGNETTPPAIVTGYLPSGMEAIARTTNSILSGNYIEATTGAISVGTGANIWTAGYVAFFTN